MVIDCPLFITPDVRGKIWPACSFLPTTMSICHSSLLVVITTLVCHVLAIYSPLHEYRGATFFDGWDYWGNVDNTTWGEFFLLPSGR